MTDLAPERLLMLAERRVRRFRTAAEIEEACGRRGCSENVTKRIVRRNPRTEIGMMPYGWHPAPTRRAASLPYGGFVSRKQFDERWGPAAHRLLRKHEMISGGGKRRWITYYTYIDGPKYAHS